MDEGKSFTGFQKAMLSVIHADMMLNCLLALRHDCETQKHGQNDQEACSTLVREPIDDGIMHCSRRQCSDGLYQWHDCMHNWMLTISNLGDCKSTCDRKLSLAQKQFGGHCWSHKHHSTGHSTAAHHITDQADFDVDIDNGHSILENATSLIQEQNSSNILIHLCD